MTAPQTNPLHLFRALLRECTYLPDARARAFMHDHVVWSYRNYLPKIRAFRKEIPLRRQVRLLHRGRKHLVLLRGANEGRMKPLFKVLSMTYGRTGKRRRELMDVLMRAEIPQDHKAVAELKAPRLYTKDWNPPPKLEALLRSQAKHQTYLNESLRGGKAFRTTPMIPEKNIWDKPLHPSRVRNMTKAWYKKVADRLLPPLPEKERMELRLLARGEGEWPGPVVRRCRERGERNPQALTGVNGRFLLHGPSEGDTSSQSPKGRPHDLTPRYMRRIWASVFRQIPQMTWNASRNKWTVQWDDPDLPHLDAANATELEIAALFGSVNLPSAARMRLESRGKPPLETG